jgi:predicted NBD/HSP70 family sugar kinase
MALSSGLPPGLESGTNLTRVKDYNEVVVLGLIRSRGSLTRPAIADATGLTLQTVSNISRRLLAAGVVLEESVRSHPNGGRTQRRLRVNDESAFAIGIKLDRADVAVAVVNLAGEIKARDGFAIGPGEAPKAVVRRMAEMADTLVARSAVPRDRVLGAGIGAPGPLDLRSGCLLSPLSFAGWDNFALRQVLSEALGMRVIMDNDATAAALGEQWRGLGSSVSSFVYLYMGHGLGAGMILGGEAFRGLRGNAGEISHIQVDPAGPLCSCGGNGCLGLYATPSGLLREARRAVLEAPGEAPPPPETIEQVLAGDVPLFADVVARGAARLAGVVVEVTRVLDPELIVLGGPMIARAGRAFQEAITMRLALLDAPGTPPPRVELSRIGDDAGVIGAATLVLHDLYAPTMGKLRLAGLTGSPPGDVRPSTVASQARSPEE